MIDVKVKFDKESFFKKMTGTSEQTRAKFHGFMTKNNWSMF